MIYMQPAYGKESKIFAGVFGVWTVALAMTYVIQETLPPVLQAVVISAIISIIMSSADSFLNADAKARR